MQVKEAFVRCCTVCLCERLPRGAGIAALYADGEESCAFGHGYFLDLDADLREVWQKEGSVAA